MLPLVPPAIQAEVAVPPAPAELPWLAPMSATSLQVVPFHDSVICRGACSDPYINPSVVVPAAPTAPLPVLNSVVSVHEVPSQSSTSAGG